MKISLSSDNILLQVYARAALDATIRDAYQTMLSPERRAALQTLLGAVAAELSVTLLPVITDTNVDILEFTPDSDTLITYDLRPNSVANPVALRLLLETAITLRLLDEIYSYTPSPSSSPRFADSYRETLRRIRRAISAPVSSLRLTPYPDGRS